MAPAPARLLALGLAAYARGALGLLLEPAAGRGLKAAAGPPAGEPLAVDLFPGPEELERAEGLAEPPVLDLAPGPEELERAEGLAELLTAPPKQPPKQQGLAPGRCLLRLSGSNLGPELRCGLANQIITFRFLVAAAVSRGCDIDLATVRWRGDWKHNETVPHELIWDVPHWNQDRRLPKLLSVPRKVQLGPSVRYVRVNALFSLWLAETKHLQKSPRERRMELESSTLLRLRPAPGIRDVLKDVKPRGHYGAVHARVELDLSRSPSMLAARVSLPQIYGLMEQSAALAGLPPEDKQSVFLAVSGDVDAETAALLQRGRGPWAGSAAFRAGEAAARRLPKQFNGCQYLAASVIDYQICLHADWFVGHTMSTFTNMLVYDRTANHRGLLNLYYNERALAVRCDDGRLDVSRQNYTAFRQANGTDCP